MDVVDLSDVLDMRAVGVYHHMFAIEQHLESEPHDDSGYYFE